MLLLLVRRVQKPPENLSSDQANLQKARHRNENSLSSWIDTHFESDMWVVLSDYLEFIIRIVRMLLLKFLKFCRNGHFSIVQICVVTKKSYLLALQQQRQSPLSPYWATVTSRAQSVSLLSQTKAEYQRRWYPLSGVSTKRQIQRVCGR